MVQSRIPGLTDFSVIFGSMSMKINDLKKNCLIPYRGMGGFSLINFCARSGSYEVQFWP
jgi:hypothetical protein